MGVMVYHIKHVLIAILTIMSLIQETGCSMIGLGMGAIEDAIETRPPDYVTIPNARIDSLSLGTAIMLTSEDGTRFGNYAGSTTESYSDLYTMNWRLLFGRVLLPMPGDTVTIVATSGERVEGQFVGFKNRSTLNIQRLEGPRSGSLAVNLVKTMVNRHGITTEGATLHRVMAFGVLPEIVVMHEGRRSLVAMDSIKKVEVARVTPRHGKRNGFIAGIVVDVILFGYVFPRGF